MTNQNPTPSPESPVPDEALNHLADLIADKLADNKKFNANVVGLTVEAAVKSVADSVQRQRQELEAYAASLTQGNTTTAPNGTVATATEKRAPKTNDEFRDAILMGLYKAVQDPAGTVKTVLDVVQQFRRPAIDDALLGSLSLGHIKRLYELKPNEFTFQAQQVIPDPMMELYPAGMVEAFKRGFGSMQEATRWARELVKQDTLAARRSTGGSSTSTPTPSSPSDTTQPAHDGGGGPAPRPAAAPAVTAQNPKPSDWKLRL